MSYVQGVRNPEDARKSIEREINSELTKGKLFIEKCDTGDMESVRAFAKKVQQSHPAIHVLINNGNALNFKKTPKLIYGSTL